MIYVKGDGSGMTGTNVYPLIKNIQLFVANDNIFAVKREEYAKTGYEEISKIKVLNQPIPYHKGKKYEIIPYSFSDSNFILNTSEEEWSKIIDFYKYVNIDKNNTENNDKATNLDFEDKIKIVCNFVKNAQNTNDLNKNNNLNKTLYNAKAYTQTNNNEIQNEITL